MNEFSFTSFNQQISLIRSTKDAKSRHQILRLKWLKMSRDVVKIQGMKIILQYMKNTHISNQKLSLIRRWKGWSSFLVQKFNRRHFREIHEKSMLVRVALAVKNVRANPIFSQVDYGFILSNINRETLPIHDISSCIDFDKARQEKERKKKEIEQLKAAEKWSKPVHLQPSPKYSPKQRKEDVDNIFFEELDGQNAKERDVSGLIVDEHDNNNNNSSFKTPVRSPIRDSNSNNTFGSAAKALNSLDNNSSPRRRALLMPVPQPEPEIITVEVPMKDQTFNAKVFFSDSRVKKLGIVIFVLLLIIIFTALYVASSFKSLKEQLAIHDELLQAQLEAQREQVQRVKNIL